MASSKPEVVRSEDVRAIVASGSEATRKLAEGAVRIDNAVHKDAVLPIEALPVTVTLRLGKRAKIVIVS